jgi:NADH-quinone oxidoreductase subunit M
MVVLTALLVPIALGASTSINKRTKEFVVFTLLLEAGMIGAFLALDMFLFFVFFEAILIPMYFIIGIWGGERRIYASIKFFIYTALGSALMLAAIIGLAFSYSSEFGATSFALSDLMQVTLDQGTERWFFAAFALAFAIKVPLFPLHTWLPDAHVEAPTAGSVLLAAVLLKLGTYGLLRFNLALFPEASVDAVPIMGVIAVIGIIYGAVVAIVQPDLKKLVAYSSVSHLGFIVLGTFRPHLGRPSGRCHPERQPRPHHRGPVPPRRHALRPPAHQGDRRLRGPAEGDAGVCGLLSVHGFSPRSDCPGLNGFVGEFLILIGSYATLPVLAIVASFGVLLAAIYLLWAYERVFTGEPDKEENKVLVDLSPREIGLLAPLAISSW